MIVYALAAFVFCYALYFLYTDVFNYWKRRGIPHAKVSKFFGNIRESILMKKNVGVIYAEIYNTFKNLKYVGIYNLRSPYLLIRDPDVIKNILVRDFDAFNDNGFDTSNEEDSILAKHPFVLKGEEWRIVRNQLSPSFSNAKIKPLLPLMEEVCKKFVEFIEREQNLHPNEGLDAKEFSAKFTTENIATCAFGLEGNCFKDPDSEFRDIGRKMLSPSLSTAIKMTIITFFPSLTKFLKLQFFSPELGDRLKKIVIDTIKYRQEHNVTRNDFLENMIKMKSRSGISDNEIVGHCAAFYVDGFETSSITLAFTMFALGNNLNVQTKLRNEIKETLAKNNGQLTYEVIQDMSYLDAVVNESLRMYSPGLFLKKVSTKRYTLPPPNGNGVDITIEPKTEVIIPLLALHNDPQYFPNPDSFEPERFIGGNRENLVKFTFLPFGDGPRACLGQKFAVIQVKLALIHVTKNFEIRVHGKTRTPIEIDPLYFMMSAKGGLWLNFHKIKN